MTTGPGDRRTDRPWALVTGLCSKPSVRKPEKANLNDTGILLYQLKLSLRETRVYKQNIIHNSCPLSL